MAPTPHKLDLYRLAVQHPQAEVAFLHRAYTHYAQSRKRRGQHPLNHATRLREDFAGTSAVACAWVAADENHRALAVESHAPTLYWAQRRAQAELGARAGDLHFVHGDVLDVRRPYVPGVDIVAALNFSAFIYHSRAALRDYFFCGLHALLSGGILVIDAYGGPGGMRVGEQRRRVTPPSWESIAPFGYRWEQRSYDAVTSRVDCRIHFCLRGGRVSRNAFRYDWRLWSLTELVELMREAGFAHAEVWCDPRPRPRSNPPSTHPRVENDGLFRPLRSLPAREDWVAYVVGVKR
jgi:hypothetical protein